MPRSSPGGGGWAQVDLTDALPTLRNDSSFAVQFSISVLKARAILLFKIKIKRIEMFELNAAGELLLKEKPQNRIGQGFWVYGIQRLLNRVYRILQLKYGYSVYHFL